MKLGSKTWQRLETEAPRRDRRVRGGRAAAAGGGAGRASSQNRRGSGVPPCLPAAHRVKKPTRLAHSSGPISYPNSKGGDGGFRMRSRRRARRVPPADPAFKRSRHETCTPRRSPSARRARVVPSRACTLARFLHSIRCDVHGACRRAPPGAPRVLCEVARRRRERDAIVTQCRRSAAGRSAARVKHEQNRGESAGTPRATGVRHGR